MKLMLIEKRVVFKKATSIALKISILSAAAILHCPAERKYFNGLARLFFRPHKEGKRKVLQGQERKKPFGFF